jgi:hypothetical protein
MEAAFKQRRGEAWDHASVPQTRKPRLPSLECRGFSLHQQRALGKTRSPTSAGLQVLRYCATAVGEGGGLRCCRACLTKLLWQGSKKEAQGPQPWAYATLPLVVARSVRKVDHPDSTDAVIIDKNILLHSCHRAGFFPPHHRFPQWNPKPRCAPRRRGFTYRWHPITKIWENQENRPL